MCLCMCVLSFNIYTSLFTLSLPLSLTHYSVESKARTQVSIGAVGKSPKPFSMYLCIY